MADVVLHGIRKTFGHTLAVDEFNLAVEQGEFVAFLGPSGCGKTTTLRMVAGFEQPDQGKVVIRGEDVTGKPPYRRDVGFVFQNYALFPHLTVADNVAYGLRMRKVANQEIRERVKHALELVRLSEFADRFPKQLSGGQQQRVALARVIVLRPSALLLDEPLSNLDAKLRKDMQVELRRLQRSLGVATIYVTHDQEEALTMADRVVVMNRGRIEQIGSPEEIYQHPSSRFVADFIGQCNFLEGELTSCEGETALFAAPGGLGLRIAGVLSGACGAKGVLAIRPENIMLLAEGEEPPPGANVVEATVQMTVYLGALRRIHVSLPGGQRLQVNQSPDLSSPGTWRLYREGERVAVAWAPGACMFQPT